MVNFRKVIDRLNFADASFISTVKDLLEKAILANDLGFIAAHFSKIPEIITFFEKRNQPFMPLRHLLLALKIFSAHLVLYVNDKCKK